MDLEPTPTQGGKGPSVTPRAVTKRDPSPTPTLMLAALGIVYGDLGTSPLYTLQTVVAASGGKIEANAALGIFSLIFWALILTISVKYCLFVMRADNRGEGGILALMSLIGLNQSKRRWGLVTAGLFGAALIYGDGILTPAISVLSALEGINLVTDSFKSYVMPAAAVILFGLFVLQTQGTATIGKLFGPVMLLWFVVIGVLGGFNLIHHPKALLGLDPQYGIAFLVDHGWASLPVLGGVFLALTGGEAMYADMGHIGRQPIRVSWFAIVLPALLLNYGGQIGVLFDGGSSEGNPFFHAVPGWAVLPMVVLATFATIIASQAIITGAFSLTRQAMQMGWFPGLRIRQTSDEEYGQIYVPVVNWTMMVCTILLTVSFGSSDRLAGAYGTAVSTTMLATTLLLYHAMRERWGWSALAAGLISGFFVVVDLVFFSANLLKILEGGWIPLLAGLLVFTLMTTWRRGTEAVREGLDDGIITSAAFLDRLRAGEIPRVPGTAVFLTRAARPVPPILIRHVKEFGALPRSAVSLTVLFEDVPRVPSEERLQVETIVERFYHLTVRYGFIEIPDLSSALRLAHAQGCDLDLDEAIFFGARDDVVRADVGRKLPAWRQMIFSFLYRNSLHMADRFNLAGSRFVEVGRRIRL